MELFQDYVMRDVIELSLINVNEGGGPFAAAVVRNGEIISTGTNMVTINCDPTAHAEIVAIRNACQKLETFDLSDCVLYTSCEPCPMCLGAIYWAHILKIYYCNTKQDAKQIGFDDSFIYDEIYKEPNFRKLTAIQIHNSNALSAFKLWENKIDKLTY